MFAIYLLWMEYFARKDSCRLFIVNILQGMGGGGVVPAICIVCSVMVRAKDPRIDYFLVNSRWQPGTSPQPSGIAGSSLFIRFCELTRCIIHGRYPCAYHCETRITSRRLPH